MKRIAQIIAGVILVVAGLVAMPATVQAAPATLKPEDCAILDCSNQQDDKGGGLFYVLKIAINILTFGIGAAATIGFIISGYQYILSRDNPSMVTKAKNRILQIVIGLVVYALFWGIINFLIPGGLV